MKTSIKGRNHGGAPMQSRPAIEGRARR